MKYELSNLIITNINCAADMYNERGAAGKRKDRQSWTVFIRYEGETVYRQKGSETVSNVGTAVVIPKGCDYEWECTESGHYMFVDFQSELKCRDIFAFSIKNVESLLASLKRIERKLITKKPYYELECISELYSVMVKLCTEDQTVYVPSNKRRILAPAIDHIAENYTKDIRNSDLAELTGLSEVYFRKLFKETYGISPISYLKEVRIKKAKELLSGDYSCIADIAVSLGYNNIYDFSRDFKKHTGVPPSLYSKNTCDG